MRSPTRLSASTALPKSKAVEGSRAGAAGSPFPWGGAAVFFLVACFGCAADLATKNWVFAWRGYAPGQSNIWWIVEGYIGIETAVNYGALFGIGQGFTAVFVTLSFVALAGVIYYLFVIGIARHLLYTTIGGMVTGGILGNLYDRLGLWSVPGVTNPYGVRDWIRLSYGDFTWPNFNIADSLLVCGALLVLWQSFRSGPPEAITQNPSDEAGGSQTDITTDG